MPDTRIARQQEMAQELERGFVAVRDSERFKAYLSTIARFHDYSMCNTLLIWTQRPDATRVAGFQTWRGMGRYVIADDLGGDDAGLFNKLGTIACNEGLAVDRAPGLGNGSNGFYARDRRLIWLRPDTSPAMAAKTFAHELAHYFAGHDVGGCRGEAETVAEGAAYIVLGHFGIDCGEYSFDYLASWTDDKVFKAKLGEIHGAASTIIDAVEGMA